MKKKYLYGTLLTASILIGACESVDTWQETIPGIVSVGKTGIVSLEAYNVGEPINQSVKIVKGGIDDVATSVHFSVEKTLIDSMNRIDGTSYELLPESCYSFTENTALLNAGTREGEVVFQYDPAKTEALCGYNTIKYVLPLMAHAEGLSLNKERRIVLYKFNVLKPDIRMIQKEPESFTISGTMPDIKAYASVLFNNKWDIGLTFKGDANAVEAYNKENGTYYSLLPEEAYVLDPVNPMLKKGSNSTTIAVKLIKGKLALGNYMLPLKLAEVSQFEVFPTATTSTFIISNPGNLIDKKAWTITANTEELVGEGPTNGHALQLIDGDINTFWHTQWQGGSHNPPHILTIDMKKEIQVARIDLARRKGQAGTLFVNFEGSSDGTNWKTMGEFSVIQIDGLQPYIVKPNTARYIRVIIPEKQPGTVAYMAEINVYGMAK